MSPLSNDFTTLFALFPYTSYIIKCRPFYHYKCAIFLHCSQYQMGPLLPFPYATHNFKQCPAMQLPCWVYYQITNGMQYSNTALETTPLVMGDSNKLFNVVPLFLMALRIS